uniref:SPASM domain-containing protein n=1 Tax=Helicobacter mesocricetorum TaxID=87012 RepID=UPI001F2CD48F
SDCRDVITNIYFTHMVVFDTEGVDTNKKQSIVSYNQQYAEICSLPWLGMQMDCYGETYVCCIMQDSAFYNNKISIGNVIENTPQEVWNSLRAKVLRKESLENNFTTFKLCANCGEKYRTFFKEDGEALEINISERY